ncbi:MAG: response regulator [Rhizobiales bacterium]|nr:response regulator [Hyphomicrobiales bacterium]
MHTNNLRILLAEDDFVNAVNASDVVENAGHEVCVASNIKEALSILANIQINAAILDYELLDGTIEPVAKLLRTSHIPYAIVSGTIRETITSQGLTNDKIYGKPADYSEIIQKLTFYQH